MGMPASTRLRYVASKDMDKITLWVSNLRVRIMIYSIAWDGKQWVCWFVPPDDSSVDVNSTRLD